MSAQHHDAAAKGEDQKAAEHAAAYDPNATSRTNRCTPGAKINQPLPCWTSERNPTATHLEEAKKHQDLASRHRAAAQALRDVEAASCKGIPDADRDVSPFYHKEDILSVSALESTGPGVKGSTRKKLLGAVITFQPVQGLTKEWLQHVVDCHLARNAAMGHTVEDMPYCPLVPDGVTARVVSSGASLAVEVQSTKEDIAKEILRRTQMLAPPTGKAQ